MSIFCRTHIAVGHRIQGGSPGPLRLKYAVAYKKLYIRHKFFELSICHAKYWWKFMVTITMSDRFIFERVLNGRFPEKINAKSLFSILVIVIQCGSMWKKRWKNHSFLPPLVRKITNLHRNRKNRKTKNIAPF